jgi:ATP-dependent RNA circularization protein (DNA/RNA ligase family)
MSDSSSNDRNKVAMRDKNSTNLNTSGREGVRVRSPSQAKNVTKYTSKNGNPYGNRR